MRIAAAACALVFAAMVVFFTLINARDLPPEELVRRCDASAPAWNGYQEDIKEIGARPVAQWAGVPVAATVSAEGVRLEMVLEPPWDEWDAVLPILLKDPEGHVHRQSRAVREDTRRVYFFSALPGSEFAMPPWIEIQYPHTKRRIHLDADGRWVGGGDPGE